MNKSMVLNTVISATAGGLLGGIVTYLTVKKTFEARTEAEVADVKQQYKLLRKEDGTLDILANITSGETSETTETNDHETDMREYAKKLIDHDYHQPVEEETGLPIGNVFANADRDEPLDPGYERIEGEPYIISREEYEEQNGYDKDSVIWYAGDDIVVDINQTTSPFEDPNMTIGVRHLDMFGQLSGDPSLVYVRNDRISTDYEILRNDAIWAVAVLGLDPEVLGDVTTKSRPQRMRADD